MKPKRLPRLWCALQGLLPLEVRGTPPHLPPVLESARKRPAPLPLKLHRRSTGGRA